MSRDGMSRILAGLVMAEDRKAYLQTLRPHELEWMVDEIDSLLHLVDEEMQSGESS